MPSLVSISDRHLSKADGVNQTDVEKNSKIDPSDGPENDVIQESTKTAVTKSNKNGEELSVELLTQETTEEIESSQNNVATSSLTSPPNKKRRVTPNDDSASKQDQQKKVNQMTLSSFFFQGDKNKKSTTTSTPPSNSSTGNKKTVLSRKHPRTDEDEDEFSSTRPKEDLSTTIISNRGSNNENENEIEIIDLESDNNDDQGNNSEETNFMEKELKSDEENQPTAVGASTVMDTSITDAASDVSITANIAKAKVTQTTVSTASITNFLTPSAVKKKRSPPTTPATAGKSSINKKITTKKIATSTARKSPKRQSTTSTKKSKSELESSSSHFAPTKVIAKTLSLEELPEERRTLLQSHNTMKARYLNRASELVTQYRDDGIEEEKDFYDGTLDLLQPVTDESELKLLENNSAETETNCKEFPTQVLTNMGLLIEGSDLPLSDLVSKVCTELKAAHGTTWSSDAVCAKIKLLSKRKAYFDAAQKSTTKVVDVFEDNDQDRLWRWEITTLDLLNTDFVSKARKARTARKKLSSYQSALLKIVKCLEDAEKQIVDPALPKLDNVIAKISRDEEKVLKFERDAEKQRLADQVKAKKLLELEIKRKAKEEALEEKRLKKEEAVEKKKEEILAREEEKRKKEAEKVQKEVQKDEEKKMQEKKKLKQKSSFRSFFAAPKKVVTEQKKAAAVTSIMDTITNQDFDTECFRSKINGSNDVLTLALNQQERTASAVACRKRRTKKIAVSVYQTVAPQEDDGWNAPSYLEQRTIKIPNKYRFLSFHENHRPAYHGTWSKKSTIVTGRNPFRKDASAFNYEDDSEGEWEEGDDEMGEDVEDDAKNQEEEEAEDADGKVYDFDDGFCVSDERLLDNEEDADEDTKALYKKKIEIQQNREREQNIHSNRISIIAPGPGGVPLYIADKECINTERVEGFETNNIVDILSSYQGMALSGDIKLSLDAFPQLHMNEENRVETSTTTEGNVANKDDYTVEEMVKMARFTHHSTLNSKDKLIEELRTAHPTVFSIRAKATRKLDAIAVKQRHPKYTSVCVYWEVKTEILTELGLTDILEKKVEDIVYENATPLKDKLVAPSAGNQESSKSKSSTGGQKRKATKESTPDKTNSTKKKKKKTVKSDRKKVANAKPTTSTPKSVPQSNAENDSPKKKKANEDASVGMKNLMAQFIKKSPSPKTSTATTTTATPKGAEGAPSAQ